MFQFSRSMPWTIAVTLLMGAGLSLIQGCKTAKYEFVEPKKKTGPAEPVKPTPTPVKLPPNEYRGTDGFWIRGTPAAVKVGETVTFEGTCGEDNKGTITWQYGDGRSGVGSKLTHRYAEPRKYTIEAECRDLDGKTQKGTIIIDVAPADNSCGCGNPGQTPGQTPGQFPVQN